MKFGSEGEEHAFAVGLRGEEFFPFEDAESWGGAIAVDAGFGMDVDGFDDFSLECGPLAAGEFDFGEFGHGERIGVSDENQIGGFKNRDLARDAL